MNVIPQVPFHSLTLILKILSSVLQKTNAVNFGIVSYVFKMIQGELNYMCI